MTVDKPSRDGKTHGIQGAPRLYGSLEIFFALIICVVMLGLGIGVTRYVRAVEVSTKVQAHATFMNALVAPLINSLPAGQLIESEAEATLDGIFGGLTLDGPIHTALIWRTDGTVIYSTNKELSGRTIGSDHLSEAAQGQIISELMTHPTLHGTSELSKDGAVMLEVYIPITAVGGTEVIAVGELYQDAGNLDAHIGRVTGRIWSAIALAAGLMAGIMMIILRRANHIFSLQQDEIKRRLIAAQKLAAQNSRLRKAADDARLEALTVNEDLLNRLGSDLHDGPLQILGLIALQSEPLDLKPGDEAAREDPGNPLLKRAITELRQIAFGLSVPEIADLRLSDAIGMAVSRHESQTGTKVTAQISDVRLTLPEAIKVSLYRAVQEALMNSFRHAAGKGLTVRVVQEASTLFIEVSDRGPGLPPMLNPARSPGLGLSGIARRLHSAGASVKIGNREGGGTIVLIAMPVSPFLLPP